MCFEDLVHGSGQEASALGCSHGSCLPPGAASPRERQRVHIAKMEAVVSHNPALGATYTIAPLHSVGHTDQPCTLWMKNTEESGYREQAPIRSLLEVTKPLSSGAVLRRSRWSGGVESLFWMVRAWSVLTTNESWHD